MRRRQKGPLCARRAAERLRHGGVRCALLWSALLLLSSCVPGQATTLATPTATATLTPTPAPFPTPTPEALPTPVATLLASAPTNCPSAPPLQTMTFAQFGGFRGSVTFHGDPPVWIPDGYFPTVLHLNSLGYDPWPGTKIVWEVGPNYPGAAIVEVTNLTTGHLAWWGQGGPIAQSLYGAAQALLLDPHTTGPAAYHGPPEAGWNEYGSFVYLLQAGCYALDATWPGGHWRAIFAAGR
jgi:hypothetical protein